MSGKERHRLELMGIKRKEIRLVKAADLMEIGYRQAKRIWKCFGETGDKSLIHGLRGKPGGRSRTKAFKQKVLTRYEERYRDPRKQETKTQGMRMEKGTFLKSFDTESFLKKRHLAKTRQTEPNAGSSGELRGVTMGSRLRPKIRIFAGRKCCDGPVSMPIV